MARITTVKGSIPAEDLGHTQPHEHVLVNLLTWLVIPAEASKMQFLEAPLSMEILGEIKRSPFSNKENLVLSDERLAVEELTHYRNWGGRTIVDVSSVGLGRDPLALRRISEATGLNIIAGAGWYVASTHPPMVKQKSMEELAEIIVKELTEGIGDTGIRAGVIGEIGCSVPYHPDEEKVLRAASRAQAETRAGMVIHPGLYDLEKKMYPKDAMRQLDIVEKEGGDLSKVYLAHCDFTCSDLAYHRALMDRGITCEYDTWGMEFWEKNYWPGAGPPSDRQEIEQVVELCRQGYDNQLVFSQDTCMKYLLVRYGGYGYAHLLKNIVPELKFRGVSEKQLKNIFIENPKKILAL